MNFSTRGIRFIRWSEYTSIQFPEWHKNGRFLNLQRDNLKSIISFTYSTICNTSEEYYLAICLPARHMRFFRQWRDGFGILVLSLFARFRA
jgi:hypothetical protein